MRVRSSMEPWEHSRRACGKVHSCWPPRARGWKTPERLATCPLSGVCGKGSPVIISSLLEPAPLLLPLPGQAASCLQPTGIRFSGDRHLLAHSGWPSPGQRLAWGTSLRPGEQLRPLMGAGHSHQVGR